MFHGATTLNPEKLMVDFRYFNVAARTRGFFAHNLVAEKIHTSCKVYVKLCHN